MILILLCGTQSFISFYVLADTYFLYLEAKLEVKYIR